VSGDDVLLGLGLVLGLAVGGQLVARLTRLPAIIVLLPAGFLAGAATDVVQPDRLLGDLYQPFVSIAVGVILFEAGLRLSVSAIAPGASSSASSPSARSSRGSRSRLRPRC
jgi:NhaP-type Na+/H+ or K+/H+ antiporter